MKSKDDEEEEVEKTTHGLQIKCTYDIISKSVSDNRNRRKHARSGSKGWHNNNCRATTTQTHINTHE